jgi:hypothetical protein
MERAGVELHIMDHPVLSVIYLFCIVFWPNIHVIFLLYLRKHTSRKIAYVETKLICCIIIQTK